MDQNQLFMMLPNAQPDELLLLQSMTKNLSETQQQQFLAFYSSRRKDKKDLQLYTVLGFICVAGIQRFVVGDTGMGILYLLTGGLCGIGTLIDLINVDKMTSTYNQKQAAEAAAMVRGAA